jgi:hypothetical protein
MPISTIGQNGLAQSRILTAVQQPAGAVLQVVSATTSANTSTSSTSYVSTSLTASITPTSSTSKILVLVSGGELDNNSTSGVAIYATIYRGSTNLSTGSSPSAMSGCYSGTARIQSTLSCSFLDSPATTSSTTYTVYVKANQSATVFFNANPNQACITLMEIAA